MSNLELWDKLKEVPKEYQKTISSGDLKGMTDIKPQWRYKVMTEQFGIVGIGWYYEITDKRIEEGNNSEKCGFVDVNLYIRDNKEWSKPIVGTGGSSFVQYFNTKKYYKTSDEVFKMALTDALSVAMAKLGVGANIYLGENDGAKYSRPNTVSDNNIKIDIWMNDNQFKQALGDIDKAKKSLHWYDNKTRQEDGKVYGMKKEYREQLKAKS